MKMAWMARIVLRIAVSAQEVTAVLFGARSIVILSVVRVTSVVEEG